MLRSRHAATALRGRKKLDEGGVLSAANDDHVNEGNTRAAAAAVAPALLLDSCAHTDMSDDDDGVESGNAYKISKKPQSNSINHP